MRFYEFKSSPAKPLTPAQARIKALKDQAKRAQAAVKAERARQKIQAAQTTLNQLESNSMSKTFEHYINLTTHTLLGLALEPMAHLMMH